MKSQLTQTIERKKKKKEEEEIYHKSTNFQQKKWQNCFEYENSQSSPCKETYYPSSKNYKIGIFIFSIVIPFV